MVRRVLVRRSPNQQGTRATLPHRNERPRPQASAKGHWRSRPQALAVRAVLPSHESAGQTRHGRWRPGRHRGGCGTSCSVASGTDTRGQAMGAHPPFRRAPRQCRGPRARHPWVGVMPRASSGPMKRQLLSAQLATDAPPPRSGKGPRGDLRPKRLSARLRIRPQAAGIQPRGWFGQQSVASRHGQVL